MPPKVSVIMPVYKVEEYVGKAIESIQMQTLEDWEMWIVDDGSPDNSGKICDKYAENDSRIHVIHKENGGAPSARNLAMQRATGKYFYFMDSDDWAEKTMLEDMVKMADTSNAQLVIAAFYIDTYYTKVDYYTEIRSQPSEVFSTQLDFRKNAYRLFDRNLLYTPWNKLYLAEYLQKHHIEFPTTFWDDFPFNLSVIRDLEYVCVTENSYYHFIRKRTESETAKYNPQMYTKREEEHRWLLELYRYWSVDDTNSREMISRRYVERLIGCIENLTNAQCDLGIIEKKKRIAEMISTSECRRALKYAKPNSLGMRLMLLPIKWKTVVLSYWEGCVISYVKSHDTKLFARLKANR